MDTSFWSAGVYVGVDAYLPLFFARPILVPTAVVREVERAGRPESRRLREDQQRFRLWLEDARLQVRDPERPYPSLGPGEAACLGLASETGFPVLINETAGYREARKVGVRAITVPEVIVRLRMREHVSREKALAMLESLTPTTSRSLLELARQIIKEGGARR